MKWNLNYDTTFYVLEDSCHTTYLGKNPQWIEKF